MEKYLKPEIKVMKMITRSTILEASGSVPGYGGEGNDDE